MQEIINSITEAEERASEIKAQALKKSAEIAYAAEERAFEIAKLSEAECKAYREKSVKQAEADAQKKYEAEMTVKRAEAAQYAAERLKDTDGAVNEIVRRVKRGGC